MRCPGASPDRRRTPQWALSVALLAVIMLGGCGKRRASPGAASTRTGAPWRRLASPSEGIAFLPMLKRPLALAPLTAAELRGVRRFIAKPVVRVTAFGRRFDAEPGSKLFAMLGNGVRAAQAKGRVSYRWRGPARAWRAAKSVFPPGHFSGGRDALVVRCPLAAGRLEIGFRRKGAATNALRYAAIVFPRWSVSTAYFPQTVGGVEPRRITPGLSWAGVTKMIGAEIRARGGWLMRRTPVLRFGKSGLNAVPAGGPEDDATAAKLVSFLAGKPAGWLFARMFEGDRRGGGLVRLAAVLRFFGPLVPLRYPRWMELHGKDGAVLYIAAAARQWHGTAEYPAPTTAPPRRPLHYFLCAWWLFSGSGRLERHGEVSRMLAKPLWYDVAWVVLMSGDRHSFLDPVGR